jgi:hypothetical protein
MKSTLFYGLGSYLSLALIVVTAQIAGASGPQIPQSISGDPAADFRRATVCKGEEIRAEVVTRHSRDGDPKKDSSLCRLERCVTAANAKNNLGTYHTWVVINDWDPKLKCSLALVRSEVNEGPSPASE